MMSSVISRTKLSIFVNALMFMDFDWSNNGNFVGLHDRWAKNAPRREDGKNLNSVPS